MSANGELKVYRIGELADLANVSRRTIDYYTRLGLLKPCTRTDGNYRLYPADSLHRLEMIKEYKKRNMTLEEIKQQLQLLDSLDKRGNSRQIVEELDRIEHELEELVDHVTQLRQQLNRFDSRKLFQAKQASLMMKGQSLLKAIAWLFMNEPL